MKSLKCPLEYWLIPANSAPRETHQLALVITNDFSTSVRRKMIAQLTDNDIELIVDYCEDAGIDLEGQMPIVVDIDKSGCLISTNRIRVKLLFGAPCEQAINMRKTIVGLVG